MLISYFLYSCVLLQLDKGVVKVKKLKLSLIQYKFIKIKIRNWELYIRIQFIKKVFLILMNKLQFWNIVYLPVNKLIFFYNNDIMFEKVS